VTIDPASYVPYYQQLAGFMRDHIARGVYRPGERLPSEGRLAQEYEVSRDTVRDALDVLRSEGRVYTVKGVGTYVHEDHEVAVEPITEGARVSARMPSDEERRRLDIPEGVPVLVVEREGQVTLLPADRVALIVEVG
jgi:GntR family transcriptional regulator